MIAVSPDCARWVYVYGPLGAVEAVRCTGPRGHESPCTFSFVPGRTGVYTLVPECGAWWSKTAIGGRSALC